MYVFSAESRQNAISGQKRKTATRATAGYGDQVEGPPPPDRARDLADEDGCEEGAAENCQYKSPTAALTRLSNDAVPTPWMMHAHNQTRVAVPSSAGPCTRRYQDDGAEDEQLLDT
ncbi:Uu.00g014580.m01.CDS01 [Anthostomella pinea]|uniref:Uu.00g014580.m01.CDS01 n=1 Tax=Anthostomella pinea TaxID=933095 RepID=A0AAI8YQ93_9PEZI|nr:Uu.00g014580.m01.CDS01 [Anthostomella pinea]